MATFKAAQTSSETCQRTFWALSTVTIVGRQGSGCQRNVSRAPHCRSGHWAARCQAQASRTALARLAPARSSHSGHFSVLGAPQPDRLRPGAPPTRIAVDRCCFTCRPFWIPSEVWAGERLHENLSNAHTAGTAMLPHSARSRLVGFVFFTCNANLLGHTRLQRNQVRRLPSGERKTDRTRESDAVHTMRRTREIVCGR